MRLLVLLTTQSEHTGVCSRRAYSPMVEVRDKRMVCGKIIQLKQELPCVTCDCVYELTCIHVHTEITVSTPSYDWALNLHNVNVNAK